MSYTIPRSDFLRSIEPMIDIIKQGKYYLAIEDHGTTVCYDENVEGIAKKVAIIVVHSLQLAWTGNKVRVRFKGEIEEAVDFWVQSEPRGEFSLILKSEEPKEDETRKFFGVFRQ
jgi:hypothetical protein